MTKRKIGIILALLCFCFRLVPCPVTAVSTSDAVESIAPEEECSLAVSYCAGDTPLSGAEVKLYKIAEVSADFKYTLTRPYEGSGLSLDGVQTAGEWNVIRSTLEAYIFADGISPDVTSVTDEAGEVHFEGLRTGMYLAIVSQTQTQELGYRFDSALVALPGLEPDGRWQYQVCVNAKGETVDPEEEIELKVLKLWRGDESQNNRPESVEVEIFCNGASYKTVTLSEENHWSYTWSAKDEGSTWTVIERNVPQGYTMTVEERQSAFVLINTWPPAEPGDPPQTGDTANILLYVLLLVGSGSVLIVLGFAGKRETAQ